MLIAGGFRGAGARPRPTLTNFISSYVIVFIHFEVFTAADKYVFVRMQTGRGHIRRHRNLLQFLQCLRFPETDTGPMRYSQNVVVTRQFNTVWMGIEFHSLHFLTDRSIPQSQCFVFGSANDVLVIATEQSPFYVTTCNWKSIISWSGIVAHGETWVWFAE